MQVFQKCAVAVVFTLTCFAVPVAVSGAEKTEGTGAAVVQEAPGGEKKPGLAGGASSAAVSGKPTRTAPKGAKGAVELQEVSTVLQNSFSRDAKDVREQVLRERGARSPAERRSLQKRQERRDAAPPKTEMQDELVKKRRALLQADFKDLHDAFRDQTGVRDGRERRGGGD